MKPTYRQLSNALLNLLNCIECDNTDAPNDERTWHCTGEINKAVKHASKLLTQVEKVGHNG